MIEATGEFGKTINELAREQRWPPVAFTVDGTRHEVNSVWAATDWLKANGIYEQNSIVVWELPPLS